jgi:diguanylate cyclase (GGDEF)-like protein
MKVTPFGLMPGMEIHASILKNIIDRDYIKRFSHRGSLVCFFLISLLTALFLIRFDASFKDFIFLPLFVFIFVFLSIRLFTGFNLFIEMIPCILLIVLNYVAIRFYQLFIKIIIANRMLRKANKALDLKVQEVTQLYQASRGLNELNDMDLVSETILNNAVLISKARYGSLLLFDEETERLVHKKSISNDHILCSKNEFDLNDKALTAKVAITKETVFIDKSQKPDNWIFNNFPEINQALYIPLTVKNNLSGVMILAVTGNSPDNPDSGKKVHLSDSEILEEKKKAEFTESDRYLLQTFATQASVTMENARLYKLAVFDGLTKLYVHRFFQNRLAQEFKRTRRYKHPLAVLLSDIDHFKSFNDTYGHQVGDIVLAGTADIFTQSVREIDLVARYGGEEFAVVLPQTDPAGAMIVAQRIRTSLEKANFIHPDGRILKVTVSLGIACYNGEEGVDSPKELVKQADLAMYYAKENGRNQCALYDETMTMSEDG